MFDTDAAKEKAVEFLSDNPTLVAAVAGASYYGNEVLYYGWGNTIGP